MGLSASKGGEREIVTAAPVRLQLLSLSLSHASLAVVGVPFSLFSLSISLLLAVA